MKITLCGSARFEDEFKRRNRELSLLGHVVYSLSTYPSDMGDNKDCYTIEQKKTLDEVHKEKIMNSDAIVVINTNGYVGISTQSVIDYARTNRKLVFFTENVYGEPLDISYVQGWDAAIKGKT